MKDNSGINPSSSWLLIDNQKSDNFIMMAKISIKNNFKLKILQIPLAPDDKIHKIFKLIAPNSIIIRTWGQIQKKINRNIFIFPSFSLTKHNKHTKRDNRENEISENKF